MFRTPCQNLNDNPADRANAVKAQVMIPVFMSYMSYSESTEKLKPKLPLLDFPVKYRKAVQEWIRLDNSGPCYLSCRCRADYEFVPGPFLATTEKHQCGTDE